MVADPLCSLFISALILISTVPLLRQVSLATHLGSEVDQTPTKVYTSLGNTSSSTTSSSITKHRIAPHLGTG
eukprot:m.196950 g.196950  ORF g.196950 m.196950 type:complete len:72 (+) comp18340_c0_seq1:167-382(+)